MWILFEVVRVVVLRFDGATFLELETWIRSLPGRIARAMVVLAFLSHAVGGVRFVFALSRAPAAVAPDDDPDASSARVDLGDALVPFVVLALGIPACALVLWS